jgi:hypothetical protein
LDTSATLPRRGTTATTTVPAKLVEMTYSTNLAPDETRSGYFISTGTTLAAPRNLGMMTGYGIFYECTVASNTIITLATIEDREGEELGMLVPGGSLLSLPPTLVDQVFGSFKIISAPEAGQAVVEAAAVEAVEEDQQMVLLTAGTFQTAQKELHQPLLILKRISLAAQNPIPLAGTLMMMKAQKAMGKLFSIRLTNLAPITLLLL